MCWKLKIKYVRGFTLIELLVVISIIALLLAIMVPALAKAKEKAIEVVCKAHLKQMYLGESLYAHDNNGRVTSGFYTATTWNSRLDPGRTGSLTSWTDGAQSEPVNFGPLYPQYIDVGKLFFCPGSYGAIKSGYGGGVDTPDELFDPSVDDSGGFNGKGYQGYLYYGYPVNRTIGFDDRIDVFADPLDIRHAAHALAPQE